MTSSEWKRLGSRNAGMRAFRQTRSALETSLEFTFADLVCHCATPQSLGPGEKLHGAHIHGTLRVRLQTKVIEYPSDSICLNDYAANLADLVGQALEAEEPRAFSLITMKESDWPWIQFIPAGDVVRVMAYRGEEPLARCFIRRAPLEAEIRRFMAALLTAVEANSTLTGAALHDDFFAERCQMFWCEMAGVGQPGG